jgi:hypothetical protein
MRRPKSRCKPKENGAQKDGKSAEREHPVVNGYVRQLRAEFRRQCNTGSSRGKYQGYTK